jgi:hypothetical protein
LPAVFAERNNACDPRASFPHWQSADVAHTMTAYEPFGLVAPLTR